MVVGPDLDLRLLSAIYDYDVEKESMRGLGLTDFHFLPHLDSPDFRLRAEVNIKRAMKNVTSKTYALDDQSALMVAGGRTEHVGGGRYLEFH